LERELKTNKVFGHLLRSDKRITIEQGGTRSGKTYNILLWIIFYYTRNHKGRTITICRKTFPSLRASVMRDFFEILRNYDLYREEYHNKSSSEYHLNGNLIEFISIDQPDKIRGRKRNLLFINEANELFFEDWQQLIFRTDGKIILDYNPSETFHWIYDRVIPRDDAEFFQTTYKDNPFLDKTIKEEIERLKDTDDDYWRIYGLGERGSSRATIFQFQIADEPRGNVISLGMDFGFTNDPTALVRVTEENGNLYIEEMLYHTNLTNRDISDKFNELGLTRYDEIWADSAEPKSIEELHRMGWNVKPTAKGADSIMAGIDILKRYKIFVTKNSTNLIKEFQNYKWQEDKNGNLLNRPVDNFNHAIDATRYATFNRMSRPNYGRYAIR
jgi:phage terminase large subunit|tara:strand:- start:883 stop:2040 length:1158 start_codon:yes stop_codon:yes gene_type:complete